MKEKIKKYLILFTMAVGMFLSTAIPSFAYTGEAEQQTMEAEATDAGTWTLDTGAGAGNTAEAPITEEQLDTEEGADEGEAAGRLQGDSFSVPGNGQLADDFSEDESKQFLTIQTKNGNTFFMVLDRSSNAENVYMLSMIDENDLAEFLEEEKETEKKTPSIILPETETKPEVKEPEKEVKVEKDGGMSAGAMLAVVIFLIGGVGGFYYFKVLKPKQDEEESDGEDLEFYDGGTYINEDQDDSDDEGEEE